MYRLSLAALWAGVALFATLAVIDAAVDFMGHFQGLFIGCMAMCFASVWVHAGLHKLNQAAIVNRGKSEQVRDDVDQLREQVDCLTDKIGEVRDLTEAGALIREAEQAEKRRKEAEPEEYDAIVYQFRLRAADGTEVIAGNRSRDHVNAAEILAALDANDTGTLPGRHSAS